MISPPGGILTVMGYRTNSDFHKTELMLYIFWGVGYNNDMNGMRKVMKNAIY